MFQGTSVNVTQVLVYQATSISTHIIIKNGEKNRHEPLWSSGEKKRPKQEWGNLW